MWRNIGAVAAGYAAIGVLVVLTDLVFAVVIPNFQSLAVPPMKYLVATLLTDSIYTVFGGYLCAAIARESAHRATLGLIVFGELMGVISAAMNWTRQPHWFAIALLAIYPPAIWFGYMLRRRRPRIAAV